MTNNKENRKLIEDPHHYNSEEYLPIAEVLKQVRSGELLDVSDRKVALALFEQNSYSRGKFLNLLLEIIQK